MKYMSEQVVVLLEALWLESALKFWLYFRWPGVHSKTRGDGMGGGGGQRRRIWEGGGGAVLCINLANQMQEGYIGARHKASPSPPHTPSPFPSWTEINRRLWLLISLYICKILLETPL